MGAGRETAIDRLEDALEDATELAGLLKGKPEEALALGLKIRVEEALNALRG